jgi:hypothetical protein
MDTQQMMEQLLGQSGRKCKNSAKSFRGKLDDNKKKKGQKN